MRVRAKVLGFANGTRQEPGAEFEIDGNDPRAFSGQWMEELPDVTPEPEAMPEAKAGKGKSDKAASKPKAAKDKPTGDAEVI